MALRRAGGRRRVRNRIPKVFTVELPKELIPIVAAKARLQGRTVPDYIREIVVLDVKNLLVLAEMLGVRVRSEIPGRSRASQAVPAVEQG